MSIAWNKVLQQALYLHYVRDNITYCLGCSGEVVGRDKIVENQFKYYYNHGWSEKMGDGLTGWTKGMSVNDAWKLWSTQHANKMAFDCSGLIDFCIGYPGNHKYSSYSFQGMPKNASVAEGCAGSALHKDGHVELDLGYGYSIGIGQYNRTVNISPISTKGFTSSHQITGVDYTGSNAR